MDLFTTFILLAGGSIPKDRTIDGQDLRSDFQRNWPNSSPRSVFYYRGNLLMALRHGHYKMHLWTWTTPDDELEKVN